MMSRFIFYNIGPGRPRDEVHEEIRNFARPIQVRPGKWVKPRWICLVEAVGYGDLPNLSAYHKIRDTSRDSRANVAVYVLKSMRDVNHRWVDLDFTWPRVESGGTHPPRSFPRISDGRLRGAVYHAPDPRAKNVEEGHTEGVRAIVREFRRAEGNPLFIPGDWNTGPRDEVNGAARVAIELGGRVVGGPPVDHAVTRGLRDITFDYRTHWRGRRLGTDHRSGALLIDARIPRKP